MPDRGIDHPGHIVGHPWKLRPGSRMLDTFTTGIFIASKQRAIAASATRAMIPSPRQCRGSFSSEFGPRGSNKTCQCCW